MRNIVPLLGMLILIICALIGGYSFGHTEGYNACYHEGVVAASPPGLRNPEMAYRHGIQLGQQMIMQRLMPTTSEKEEARQAAIKLVQQADREGLGLDSKPLDEYRTPK